MKAALDDVLNAILPAPLVSAVVLRAAGLFSAVYHASATPQPHRPAEWRRGPDGRNTLCNGIALFAFVWRRGCDVLTACGLKFARTYLKKALNKPASGIRKRRSDDEETTIGMASPLQENLAQTFPPVVQPVRSLLPQLIIRCLTLTPGDSPSSCLPMTWFQNSVPIARSSPVQIAPALPSLTALLPPSLNKQRSFPSPPLLPPPPPPPSPFAPSPQKRPRPADLIPLDPSKQSLQLVVRASGSDLCRRASRVVLT
jgi:hypothetical protein